MRTTLFLIREMGWRETRRLYVSRVVCALLGHKWQRHTWFESWDTGIGYESYWWACNRCERWSGEKP